MCPMSDAQQKLYEKLFKKLKKTPNGDSMCYSDFMPTCCLEVLHNVFQFGYIVFRFIYLAVNTLVPSQLEDL